MKNKILLLIFIFQSYGISWCGDRSRIECYESIDRCDQIGFKVEGNVIIFEDNVVELPLVTCKSIESIDVIFQKRKRTVATKNNSHIKLFNNPNNYTLKSGIQCCNSGLNMCFEHEYCLICNYGKMSCTTCQESNQTEVLYFNTMNKVLVCEGETENGFYCLPGYCLKSSRDNLSCITTLISGCKKMCIA